MIADGCSGGDTDNGGATRGGRGSFLDLRETRDATAVMASIEDAADCGEKSRCAGQQGSGLGDARQRASRWRWTASRHCRRRRGRTAGSWPRRPAMRGRTGCRPCSAGTSGRGRSCAGCCCRWPWHACCRPAVLGLDHLPQPGVSRLQRGHLIWDRRGIGHGPYMISRAQRDQQDTPGRSQDHPGAPPRQGPALNQQQRRQIQDSHPGLRSRSWDEAQLVQARVRGASGHQNGRVARKPGRSWVRPARPGLPGVASGAADGSTGTDPGGTWVFLTTPRAADRRASASTTNSTARACVVIGAHTSEQGRSPRSARSATARRNNAEYPVRYGSHGYRNELGSAPERRISYVKQFAAQLHAVTGATGSCIFQRGMSRLRTARKMIGSVLGGADALARSELMATRRATHIGDETLLTGVGGLVRVPGGGGQRRMPRPWPGRSG